MQKIPDDMSAAGLEQRRQLRQAFLERAVRELNGLRDAWPELAGNDAALWQEVRFSAQQMHATANKLDLPLLAACAAELARLADDRFAGTPVDEHLLDCVASAIETIGLELTSLEGRL